MSKKYEGPNGIIVSAYTAKVAAIHVLEKMLKKGKKRLPHRIWVKSIKSGRFPIISKMKDSIVYGKIHRFCCGWYVNKINVVEYFAESTHEYDDYDKNRIIEIAKRLGLSKDQLCSYSPKNIDTTSIQKLLFAIDNNQESLKIYNIIANNNLSLFGDPTKLSVKTSNPEYITIKRIDTEFNEYIHIRKGNNIISTMCDMQKKYETLKNNFNVMLENTQRELGAGVDFYVAKCETMKEEIAKLNAKLERAENKAKIFEESFIRVEEENDRLRANDNNK